MHYKSARKNSGFTLIELIVVIAVVGILSAILTRVINIQRHRDIAEDAVRLANVEKLAEAIESFCALERGCPAADTAADPDLAPDEPLFLTRYITQWPDGTPDTAIYSYGVSGGDFRVSTANDAGLGGFKYWSGWGEVRDCAAPNWNADNGNC